jgi:putative OPT family oligopeptide transporter
VNNTIKPKELTIRGLILGALITTIFTAANVYLGLKVGLTFASSIPAAVISMAILSVVKDSSILENNIVQTVASAAGTLSAIIFVLPGLVIVGWWTGFPFWQSFLICLSGGVLGVLFTIPLRRALVTNSDLPYPEGVAAAEVLKVGSGTRGETKDETGEAREGLIAVILGSVGSAGLAILTATRIAAASVTGFFKRLRHRVFARARRRRTPGRIISRHGYAHRPHHRMGHRSADIDFATACCRRRHTRCAYAGYLAHTSSLHRRGRDRDRCNLHARSAC